MPARPQEATVLFALQLLLGWFLLSIVVAFGLGPVLRSMSFLAARHESPGSAQDGRAA